LRLERSPFTDGADNEVGVLWGGARKLPEESALSARERVAFDEVEGMADMDMSA